MGLRQGGGRRAGPAAKAWIRGAVRRPARALVVILTLAVMTVGVAASLVAGDSLERLFVLDAVATWAGVDVEVTSDDDAVFEEGLARLVAAEAGGVATRFAPRLILRAVADAGDRRTADAVVLGLGPEEENYAPLQAVDGASDPVALEPGQALVNARMARRLALGVGDTVSVGVAVPQVFEDVPGQEQDVPREPRTVDTTFEVAGVVADAGVADLHRTPNLVVRRDALQSLTDLSGRVSALHFSAPEPGENATDDLVRTIQPLLRRTGLTAATPTVDALKIADDEGGQFRSILIMLALLVVAAAVVAVIQMLIALAQDRSREIAVLRVLGSPQRLVTRLVAGEATAYAIVGVAIGLALSLPAASFIATRLASHFAALSAGRGREQVALEPFVDPVTLITSAVIVLAAAVLAGRAAGRRLSGVDVDVLLRGPLVDLPPRPLSSGRPVLLALAGALLLGMGLSGGAASDALRYLGLTLLGGAQWLRLRRTADRARVDTIGACLALVWAIAGAGLLTDFSQGYETGFGTLVVAGVVSIVAVTVLVAGRFRGVMRVLRSYVPRGRWQAALRTAGSYAEMASGRTGRLHATFGIVLFMAAALQVLGSATQLDVARQSGGFDVVATSVARLDIPAVANTDGVAQAVAMPAAVVPEDRFGARPGGDDDADILRGRYPVRLVGITGQLPDAQSFGLADSLDEYGSAAAALEAVVRDGDKVVVDRYSLPPGAAVGDDIVIDLGGQEREYQLIAVLDSFLLGGALIADNELADLGASSGPTLLLARGEDGVTAEQVVTDLEDAGASVGLDARTMAEIADDVVVSNRTFTDTFALILLLGLAVALVAVGAMLVRSARERRPYLAVLRAMGFRRSTVAVTVAAEPVAVAAVGAVAGTVVGLLVLRALFAAGFSDLAFVVDGGRTAAVVLAVIGLLVIVSTAAAWPAVPRDPSDALRDLG